MFAYCCNNPVMYNDYSGEFLHIIAGAFVNAVISFVSAVVTEISEKKFDNTDEFNWGDVWRSTGIGAVEGALIASFPTMAPLISTGACAADSLLDGLLDKKSPGDLIIDTITSAGFGFAGSDGSDFVKGGIMDDVLGAFGNIMKRGSHPAVKNRASAILKNASNAILDSLSSGLFGGLMYDGLAAFSSWCAKSVIEYYLGG